jgi:hypothetical protein
MRATITKESTSNPRQQEKTMRCRGFAAAVVVGVLLASGCSPAAQEVLSPEKRTHDRTVADLGRRAGAEDGWVVLELANLHEGGGATIWWLHPCDPDTHDTRQVTLTAYHGSDVATLPGHHQVDTTELACDPPSRDIDVAGRHLRLDVDAVMLGGHQVGLVDDHDQIAIADVDHDTTHTLEKLAQPTYGPCDDRTAWSATLDSPNQMTVFDHNCVGRLAALPDDALALLDLPADGHPAQMSSARLPDDRHAAFLEALANGGLEPDSHDVLEHTDDPSLSSLWRGPCGPSPSDRRDGDTHTLVDVHAGHASTSERACR